MTSKQIHNLEKLTDVPVIDRERLILDNLTLEQLPLKQKKDELKVDKSKVFVILSKSDSTQPERIDEIANALGISNPIVMSSKTG